jgi:hypothetical protein
MKLFVKKYSEIQQDKLFMSLLIYISKKLNLSQISSFYLGFNFLKSLNNFDKKYIPF